MTYRSLTSVAALALLAACGETAKLPVTAGQGPSPQLPAPVKTLIPTINTAKPIGWAADAAPTPAPGLAVRAMARGLDHPRWLMALPNGDTLVAETSAPAQPDEKKGIRGFFQGLIMGRAGATSLSPNRILLLRDTNGDGVADKRHVFASGLNAPFGMALAGDRFCVAETDKVTCFPYVAGATSVTGGVKLADLPAGTRNHHWTKSLIASADGKTLYVGIGSNSNVGDNGIEAEAGRARVVAVDLATGAVTPYATGLRNPVGLAWQPGRGKLWVAVNERDEIGSDLVPDFMTSLTPGGFYGWPWSWYGSHVDERVKPARPDLVAKAITPDYALGPHTASLGLAFAAPNEALGPAYADGAFVGQHGSWNRKPASGYKVVFVAFANGSPQGLPKDVLTGFLTDDGKAHGRPVGVAFARDGALLVADDVGNVVWRVTAAAQGH